MVHLPVVWLSDGSLMNVFGAFAASSTLVKSRSRTLIDGAGQEREKLMRLPFLSCSERAAMCGRPAIRLPRSWCTSNDRISCSNDSGDWMPSCRMWPISDN